MHSARQLRLMFLMQAGILIGPAASMFFSCSSLLKTQCKRGFRKLFARLSCVFPFDFAFVAMLFHDVSCGSELTDGLQMDCQAWDKGMNYSDQAGKLKNKGNKGVARHPTPKKIHQSMNHHESVSQTWTPSRLSKVKQCEPR